jgi:hypothetical protein
MHDYSIDRHPKEVVLFVLAFVAISGAPALNRWIADIVESLNAATGWAWGPVTAIPVFALFGLIYWLFNTRLWKLGWLRGWLLVPDLNGTWKCEGLTVLRQGTESNTPWTGEVVITQSWSKMQLYLKTPQSASNSVSASIAHEPGVGYRLLYHYRNAPDASQLELKKHDGAAEILFADDCQTGQGCYFTDQHRRTVGTMALRKA